MTKVVIEKETNNNIVEVQGVKREDHIVYTNPNKNVTHSVMGEGDGPSLGRDFCDVCLEFDSEQTVEAVVCDGTVLMTGCHYGMIASAEKLLDLYANCMAMSVQ